MICQTKAADNVASSSTPDAAKVNVYVLKHPCINVVM